MTTALRRQLRKVAPRLGRLRRALHSDSPCRGRVTKLGKIARHPGLYAQRRRLLALHPLPERYGVYRERLVAMGFARASVETFGIYQSVLDFCGGLVPSPDEVAARREQNHRASR